MSDHGDEATDAAEGLEARVPWVTAEKMVAWLLAAALAVLIAGIATAIDGWTILMAPFVDPNDPSAGIAVTPDLVTRLANAFQGLGRGADLLMILGFVMLFLLWRNLDELEAADGGDVPLAAAEVSRTGWWLRGVQVVFGATVVAALGSVFGWGHQAFESRLLGGDRFTWWADVTPWLGIALAGIAGLVGVGALLRDQRDLFASLPTAASE